MNNFLRDLQPDAGNNDEFEYYPDPGVLRLLKQAAAERITVRKQSALSPFPNDIVLAAAPVPSILVLDTEILPRYLSSLAAEFADRTPEVVDSLRRSGHDEQVDQRLQLTATVDAVIQDIRLSTELTQFFRT